MSPLGTGARHDFFQRSHGQELDDGRLQALVSSLVILLVVDLDVGQALGAVDADELGVLVDFLADMAAPPGTRRATTRPFGMSARRGTP
jgi:hypothetical protein